MIAIVYLQRCGNGAAIKLPKKVVDAANINLNQRLIVRLEGGSLVLTPAIGKKKATLDSILDGVTSQKIRGELHWGNDVGVERYET